MTKKTKIIVSVISLAAVAVGVYMFTSNKKKPHKWGDGQNMARWEACKASAVSEGITEEAAVKEHITNCMINSKK